MRYRALFILVSLLAFCSQLSAQSVEEELGFIYMKAEYLLETDRYDEAIAQYTAVIAQDPTYKDAAIKRTKAKFALKSYRGVKKDILEMISVQGIDAESVEMLGLAEHHLGNHQSAVNSLVLAHQLKPRSLEIIEALAVSANQSKNSEVCDILSSVKGSVNVKNYLNSYCGTAVATTGKKGNGTKPSKPGKTTKPKSDKTVIVETTDRVIVDSELEEVIKDVEEEEETIIDDTVNTIVIDEDLTILIKNGIGSRKVIDQPNILMLSEQSGIVKVNICLSKGGRITSGEIDPAGSTIQSESLRSLALRKAKEFWFARGDQEESCGSIEFIINGG